MHRIIQADLGLPAFVCGEKKLAAVISGTALGMYIPLFLQAFYHTGERCHGTTEISVDLCQGCPLLGMTEDILQNMSLYGSQSLLLQNAVGKALYLYTDLPEIIGYASMIHHFHGVSPPLTVNVQTVCPLIL